MGKMLTVEMQIAKWINERNRKWRNRMQESCSYGSVGERGGNEPLYPEMVLRCDKSVRWGYV